MVSTVVTPAVRHGETRQDRQKGIVMGGRNTLQSEDEFTPFALKKERKRAAWSTFWTEYFRKCCFRNNIPEFDTILCG